MKSRPKRTWKPNRRERRVLLALLSGAANLSGYPIYRAAQVGSGTVYVTLWRLMDCSWVTRTQERKPDGSAGRAFYALTPRGRSCAMALLGLEEKR